MAVRKLKNYVNGAWVDPAGASYLDVENPSTGEVISQVPLTPRQETDRAIEAAYEAYLSWKDVPVSRRVSYLFKLRDLLEENEEKISRILVEEMGKSLPDARAEMKRVFENVEVACGMPVMQQGDKLIGASFEIDGEVIRLPMGVFGMIAPFNFPAMVPFWFLPYAIATGNSFVVKASKQVPNTMNFITELIHQTGLPAGVYTLINGDRTVADAFMEHPLVQGVSLVGSTPTCRLMARKCAENGKRFQAMGGAKNHLVVMPDARLNEVIRNMITSCFGCAGQRCMAASAIVCVGDDTYARVTEEFVRAARDVITTNPLDPAVADESMVMGPVISAKAKEFILGMIDTGVKEGAELLLDGRDIKVAGYEKGYYIGPTVFGGVKPGMQIHQTEIFGPVVVILKADSLDEAIGIINDHQYGNGASIYTQNGWFARKFKIEVKAGMIGVNVGIPAPVAYLPFGGMKNSQFADIKAQGKAIVNFYTEDKIITERFWSEEG
ncbi:methylmalonate-semialdehyde dehydrogenase (CoA acylating) [Marispirochaeta aestuarii]|uniref:methylmalonate-semialdehyde dehydrogenase (CoA acylating) n=1 Tax=Marispirochaeta aestuarii TaxID=1963862 RepID=A0A1Y1RZG2_9SPIO|nr:CoA-acylating methylmalonate-semialdehyde dehydrogenase [Marispirochaeta aestuarii]ORC35963.1 methylmalonate-semialdehyde dehydrogenase (CoA acylating) [Marispirochaeta aestuarii]